MQYRLRTLLIGVTLIGIALACSSVSFLTLPLRETDKTEAARHLVTWIVDSKPIPGFGELYPDNKWMPGQKRFFVICDFVPADVKLSSDPRVQRISGREYDAVFKQHDYDKTAYIRLGLKEESKRVLVVEFSNSFGWLAAHGYRFEFRRKLWGLHARGRILWVS